ncbi:family 16 glycosylhydrolase [Draconibacterium sp. IB214405]|uniref:family 16 glycosylhydrolase n=1 Tax=Draconibacterium sp. IB214405 TaxID=3097352 RepID=UPI002A13210E|nr:family 16 glycosylhydrolase [Draconibacterium sp. IB214405]MDX8337563.1 family 16 glycosylhydrolase [Draconibacterium sp. IB214405]
MLKSFNKQNWLFLLAFLILVTPLNGCSEDGASASFSPDFSYSFIDENNVRYTNETEGEYWRMEWNFGNGSTETTISKTEEFTTYYPKAGDYQVTLQVTNKDDEIKSVSKTVTVTHTDFAVDFSANIDGENPNIVHLENTTIGDYDSFQWTFRNKIIENESTTQAYFPYAGTYSVELVVTKDGETFSSTQNISIAANDPDYFSKLELVWVDNFDGNEVNTDNWSFETGSGGWGNNELQNYTNGSNASVQDGILTITAKKLNDDTVAGSYTSTRIITSGKKEFTYGRMEIRAKLPSGRGIWPAIWMLGADIGSVGWPACGEIDIMEYVGYEPNTIHATVHTSAGYGGNGSGNNKTLETAEEEFHVYGLFWTEKELVFYTDSPENVTHRYAPANKTNDNWPFNKPQFFILNVAVGGNWGGAQGIDNAIFPQSMEVDYVRVYQEM